eukprot:336842-Pyramimonas_sp.AAC.1
MGEDPRTERRMPPGMGVCPLEHKLGQEVMGAPLRLRPGVLDALKAANTGVAKAKRVSAVTVPVAASAGSSSEAASPSTGGPSPG